MNKKMFLSACLTAFLGLTGCVRHYSATTPAQNTSANEVAVTQKDYICQTNKDPNLCPKDPFVNYTRTAADYRRYGERTPRDYMVSRAAAGNNLSASIPPSIEDEVVYYEEQVMIEKPVAQKAEKPTAKTAKKPVEEVVEEVAEKPVENEIPAVIEEPKAEPVTEAPAVVEEVQAVIEEPVETKAEEPTTEAVEPEVTEEPQSIEEVVEDVTEEAPRITEETEISEFEDDEYEDLEDPVKDWLAEEGQNLKALLTDWTNKSGWRLIWNTNRNYVLNAGAIFRGRFADVSSALIRAFARARPAPIATFYKGNRVLVVETMEDENAYE